MVKHNIYNHPGQLISVDCIIFGYHDNELKLLLFNRKLEPSRGELSLVGGWVNTNESVYNATRRVLQAITGLENIFMEMVDIFSETDRDPGGRVISIAFYALMPIDDDNIRVVQKHGASWHPMNNCPNLIFDHNEMVEKALDKLRLNSTQNLIGEQLLPETFTLLQLRKLYNAIYQREFDPGNFRKKVLSLKVLEQLNIKDTSESKKGAYLYQFKPENERPANDRIFKI